MQIRPDHVAIYIRWSTEDQGDGTTLEVQREGCRHYVLSQGWAVNPGLVFVDDGYSGGTLKRPALAALREQVRLGAVDCVVVYKLDRLSRSVLDTVNLVLDEWEGRCHVKSAREPIDTTNPAGKLFFYMLLSYAEWERSVIRDRTFSGKVRRAREGRVPGRYPYGLRPGDQPGTVAVVPAEAAVVGRIFALYGEGLGLLTLARRLNAEGVPSPGGGRWHRSAVRYILTNPLYKGELVYLRRSRNPRRERDASQPYYTRNREYIREQARGVAPLVPPAVFDQVQARLAGRQRGVTPPRALDSGHLLTGLLRCRCGSGVAGSRARGYLYYVCGALREKGSVACPSGWVRQDAVDQAVLGAVLARYGAVGRRLPFLPELVAGERRQQGAADRAAQDLRRRLQALADAAARLNRAFRAGELPPALYRENHSELDAELRQVEALLVAARPAGRATADGPPGAPVDPAGGAASAPAGLAARYQALDQWGALSRPQQKEVLRALLERVELFRARGSSQVAVHLVWGGQPGREQIP